MSGDPAAAIGDTAPNDPVQPQPQVGSGGNCGGFGKVLLVVIAVAVATVVTGGVAGMIGGQGFMTGVSQVGTMSTAAIAGGGSAATATAAGGFVAGAVGGAVGSIASQAVGVATGIQEKFSWNQVGLTAISGGLAGSGADFGISGDTVLSAGLRGAASSALTQGIGVAVGLQKEFSWAGVAAAGVGAAAGRAVSGAATLEDGFANPHYRPNMGLAASTVANAATRSLVEGTDFGDNLIAALPDVIGQSIGRAIAGGIAAQARETRTYTAFDQFGRRTILEGMPAEAGSVLPPASQDGDGLPLWQQLGRLFNRGNVANEVAVPATEDVNELFRLPQNVQSVCRSDYCITVDVGTLSDEQVSIIVNDLPVRFFAENDGRDFSGESLPVGVMSSGFPLSDVEAALSAEYETHRSTINLLHQLSYGIEIVTQEAIGGRGAGLGRIEYSAGTDFTEPDYELLYYDISDSANGRNYSRSDFLPSSYSISDFGLSNGAHRALQTVRHERLHYFFPGRREGTSRAESSILRRQEHNRHQTLENLLAETMITAYGFSGEYLAYQARQYRFATVETYQVPDAYLALGQQAQATQLTDLTRLNEGGN